MHTQEQMQVITCNDPLAAVIAAPGSGKTTTIIARARWLIDQRIIAPGQLAMITFTRAAAAEMKHRLAITDDPPIIGTFHGVLLDHINARRELLGFDPRRPLTIIDEDIVEPLIDQLERQHGLKTLAGKAIGTWNGRTRAECQSAQTIYSAMLGARMNANFWVTASPADLMAWRLTHAMQSLNAITMEGITAFGLRLITDDPTTLGAITHLIVDEAQDCDTMQLSIIRAMINRPGVQVMVVGDFRQAIYEWRGASPEGLETLISSFAKYTLSKSFRCGEPMIGAAVAMYGDGQGITPNDQGTTIGETLLPLADRDNAWRQLCAETMVAATRMMHFGQTAILVPTNRGLNAIARLLSTAKIPFWKRSATDDTAMQSLVKLLTRATLRDDSGLLKLGEQQIDPRSPIREALSRLVISEVNAEIYETFIECDQTVEQFLTEYRQTQIANESLTRPPADAPLIISTIHGVKGLEFDNVVMMANDDDAKRYAKGEGKRILFVGMTRAWRNLRLVSSSQLWNGDDTCRD